MAGHCVVVYPCYLAVRGAVLDGVVQVNQEALVLGTLGPCVALPSHTRGGGHLCLNVPAVEHHAVIPRLCRLRLVAEQRRVARVRPVLATPPFVYAPSCGHEDDITQVAASRTAEVNRAEAYYLIVVHAVARAPVPALLHVHRTHHHQSERHTAAHSHMAVVVRTNHRVHITSVVLRPRAHSKQHRCCNRNKITYLHNNKISSYFATAKLQNNFQNPPFLA